MTKTANKHNDCHSSVCAICFDKTKQMRKVSTFNEKVIKQHVYNQYN